jgi:hypothetical protein
MNSTTPGGVVVASYGLRQYCSAYYFTRQFVADMLCDPLLYIAYGIPGSLATLVARSQYAYDTFGESMDNAFIHDWSYKIAFNDYFRTCAPARCQYFVTTTPSVIETFTVLMGLLGGLATSLRLIVATFNEIYNCITGSRPQVTEESMSMPHANNSLDMTTITNDKPMVIVTKTAEPSPLATSRSTIVMTALPTEALPSSSSPTATPMLPLTNITSSPSISQLSPSESSSSIVTLDLPPTSLLLQRASSVGSEQPATGHQLTSIN